VKELPVVILVIIASITSTKSTAYHYNQLCKWTFWRQ